MIFLKSPNVVLALTALMITLIAGCASQKTMPPADREQDKTTSVSEEPVDTKTADLLLTDQQLSAVEALLDSNQIEEAQIILSGLNNYRLETHQQTKYALIQAKLALALGDGQAALKWLIGEYVYLFDGLPLPEQINISLMRSQAFELAGLPLSAARERIFLAPLLEDFQVQQNHDQIWFDLQLVDKDQLIELSEVESSPDLNGWINLSLIGFNQSEDLYGLLMAVENWQKQNKSHPAAKNLPGSLKMLRELSSNQPKHIGVFLPLSGKLENLANAIRNGLLSSWYQSRSKGLNVPELRFYDTADVEDIQNLYKQAVINGAETIIGPLNKSKVQRLSMAVELSVPVLALNYADTQMKSIPNFYQFGLAPEDEATQVANDIWQQGIRNVLVIAPNNKWGARVSDAFVRIWQLKGGIITSKAMFNPSKNDSYLGSIKGALNLTDSGQRHRLIQKILNEKIAFENRRRQDVDMIFMLASPTQARQLKPILDYQHAADIPIVATSHIYSGKNDSAKDKDLDGIHFVEMPWRLANSPLKNSIHETFPESLASNTSSLVALGIDAYRLYSRLPQMLAFNEVRVQGVSGALAMSSQGKIIRELDWATIVKGNVIYSSPGDIIEQP